MKSAKKFDIVVYGGSGFTGQLVAEYLASRYAKDSDLKWAMAGRDLDKLASVRDAIGAPAGTPLIAADAGDSASLKAMIDQTRLVLTTVGPYSSMAPTWLRRVRLMVPIISTFAASRSGCGR